MASPPPVGQAAPPLLSQAYSRYALGLLAVVNLLNYLDRNVIFALFEPIKRDLMLTDTQLGWLGSAYIIVFSLAALPFGVMSDLRSRRAVIAGGVTLWSAFTLLSGFTRNFWQMFACRAAVGVGEAAYGPAAQSLVADYFPGRARAFAMGILASGVALGGVLGLLLGGWLEDAYGWRAAFFLVALPGFICAVLVGRLRDPTRVPDKLVLTKVLSELEVGLATVARQFMPLIGMTAVGGVAAVWLDQVHDADSKLDIAIFGAFVGLGVALTIMRWVRHIRADQIDRTPFGGVSSTWDEVMHGVMTVLRTPTLVFIFIGGALTSFGNNGLVGWAPTFAARELSLTSAQAAVLFGKWGLIFGTAGTIFGGFLADWLRKYTKIGRVLTVAMGLIVGGALSLWLLTIRDLTLFVPVFCAAFFCLTWFNGPISAVIFDVVPARIGATVIGAYLLFIHLAGDAIALPLVGMLSDRFGLSRAIMLLPLVTLASGFVVLGAIRTVARDMAWVQERTSGAFRVPPLPRERGR